MIIKPKTRGFICTTAHPDGCAANVGEAAARAEARPLGKGPGRVLVIGSSTGYGLACRIASAFCCGAETVGVFFERPASGERTATAGWYNNASFERLAREKGLTCESLNGDAFSPEMKAQTIDVIKNNISGGQIDLVIYSLAAPRRADSLSGVTYSSVIKPVDGVFSGKSVDFHTGRVSDVEIAPATDSEIAGTVAVMGGEDWLLWMKALSDAGVLASNAGTVAFSYIGPDMTHAIYKDGTIGRAKEDLEAKCREINTLLSGIGGRAYVSVNKALVTQASSAIPVVPLYISILYKIMKEQGTHEDCTGQMIRMFERMYGSAGWDSVPVDEAGRIRMDDWEMDEKVQKEVADIWQRIDSENIGELADLKGYRDDFYRLFGFGVEGVDYDADVRE